jgi:hypothetical protein
MVRTLTRKASTLAAAAVVTAALSLVTGPVPAQAVQAGPAGPAGGVSARDAVTCEEAQAAFAEAKADRTRSLHALAKAKKHLHQVYAHGTAAQLQQAKNRVRRAKAKAFEARTAVNQAAAQVESLC